MTEKLPFNGLPFVFKKSHTNLGAVWASPMTLMVRFVEIQCYEVRSFSSVFQQPANNSIYPLFKWNLPMVKDLYIGNVMNYIFMLTLSSANAQHDKAHLVKLTRLRNCTAYQTDFLIARLVKTQLLNNTIYVCKI